MGRLIYNMNVSLDGFIETPERDLGWALVDEELHTWFNERAGAVQAELYGRRTYELMAAYWPTGGDDPAATPTTREFARIWNSTPKIVFSSSLGQVEHNSRLVRGDVGSVLEGLRREFEGDLAVGGANLAGQFVRQGLVDEYQLVVHPVVLGSGTPFWPELDEPLRLRQVDSHLFGSEVELRSYVPA